jgi:hypothetical protein
VKRNQEGTMRRILAFMLLAGFAGTGVALAAGAADADRLRELTDRVEIEDLMWRYCRALDTLNEGAYADVYTADGTFTYNGETSRGRAGLMKVISDTRRTRQEREAQGGGKTPPIYHVIATHTVTFTGRDTARYDSYWMTVYGTTGANAPVRVNSVGRAIDELVRVNGKWLIRTRNISPDG